MNQIPTEAQEQTALFQWAKLMVYRECSKGYEIQL